MKSTIEIKKELFQYCSQFVDEKKKNIEQVMISCKKSLESETKSSAGDKHETGRAMVQLEMEKAGQQLQVVQQMKELLEKVTFEFSTYIRLGSLVTTNMANYYIAVSAGKIIIDDKTYYAVSPQSPIGKLLLGRQQGENLLFNHKEINISTVV